MVEVYINSIFDAFNGRVDACPSFLDINDFVHSFEFKVEQHNHDCLNDSVLMMINNLFQLENVLPRIV